MLKAVLHSRLIISFTSKEDYIEHLSINVPQEVNLPANGSKYYSLEYYQDFKVKIVRVSGFPAFAYDVCHIKSLNDCIERLENNPGSTINSKIDQISVPYQESSMTIVKFTTGVDPANF